MQYVITVQTLRYERFSVVETKKFEFNTFEEAEEAVNIFLQAVLTGKNLNAITPEEIPKSWIWEHTKAVIGDVWITKILSFQEVTDLPIA